MMAPTISPMTTKPPTMPPTMAPMGVLFVDLFEIVPVCEPEEEAAAFELLLLLADAPSTTTTDLKAPAEPAALARNFELAPAAVLYSVLQVRPSVSPANVVRNSANPVRVTLSQEYHPMETPGTMYG